MLFAAVMMWSLCTMLTPIVATSLTLLLCCRVALGLFEGVFVCLCLPLRACRCVFRVVLPVAGVFFPAAHHFLSGHVPASERSRAIGVINTGNSLGTVIAFFVCPWLSTAGYGWQSSFYLFGFAGILWAIVWFLFAEDAEVLPPPESVEDGSAAEPTCATACCPSLSSHPQSLLARRYVHSLVMDARAGCDSSVRRKLLAGLALLQVWKQRKPIKRRPRCSELCKTAPGC